MPTKKKSAKKPRNYGATESTLESLQKTRRDVAAVVARVAALEDRVRDLEAPRIPDEPTVETVPGEPWR